MPFFLRTLFTACRMSDPNTLRQTLRSQRRALSASERHHAAVSTAQRAAMLSYFQHAQHLALYLAFDGELDPAPLVRKAWDMGKQVYLPVLRHKQALRFVHYHAQTPMQPNRFGIPEPVLDEQVQMLEPQQLDLVFTPLVGFDLQGTRIGMGGGFYDRSFAFRLNPHHQPRPRLVGLAYELQRCPTLARQDWDVPLDAVITEAQSYSITAI